MEIDAKRKLYIKKIENDRKRTRKTDILRKKKRKRGKEKQREMEARRR